MNIIKKIDKYLNETKRPNLSKLKQMSDDELMDAYDYSPILIMKIKDKQI